MNHNAPIQSVIFGIVIYKGETMRRKYFNTYGLASLFVAYLRVDLGVKNTYIKDEYPGGFIVEWNEE